MVNGNDGPGQIIHAFFTYQPEELSDITDEKTKEIRENGTLEGTPCFVYDSLKDLARDTIWHQMNGYGIATPVPSAYHKEAAKWFEKYAQEVARVKMISSMKEELSENEREELEMKGTVNGDPVDVFETLEDMANHIKSEERELPPPLIVHDEQREELEAMLEE